MKSESTIERGHKERLEKERQSNNGRSQKETAKWALLHWDSIQMKQKNGIQSGSYQ